MTFSVRLHAGQGLLARYGGSVLLAPRTDDSGNSGNSGSNNDGSNDVTAQALDLLRQVAESHPDAPGQVLPRRLAGLIAQSDATPTLAVVSALDDGLAVLLVGDVRMVLTTDAGTTVQSGRDASTWVDRVVRGPWTSLDLVLEGAGALDPLSDLAQGVVTAGGAELTPAGAHAAPAPAPAQQPAPAPAPAPAPEAPAEPPTAVAALPPADPAPAAAAAAEFETFSLGAPSEALAPLPVEQPEEAGAEASPETSGGDPAVVVRGIMCSRRHFNDPTSIYCAICGISMVQQTHNLVTGPRPPLGVLVLDDGTVYALARDYVLGREPENAPEVLNGQAEALPLDDPDVTMSRVHAKVQLVDWTVELVDAGSANGTFTAAPGETDWTRLPANGRVALLPGTKIALGGRTLVFDSHHKL